MKERWFNYRPICLTFSFLLLGSLFAFYFNKQLVLVISIAIIVASLLLVLAIYKKKLRYFGLPLTAFIIGVFAYNIAVMNFNKTIDYKPTQIEARVNSIGKPNDSYIKLQADNCFFDGEKSSDNIYIIVYDSSGLYENLEVGSIIKFSPNGFESNNLFSSNSTPNTSLYANDLKYTAVVNIEDIKFLSVDKTFAETVKENIKDNLALSLTTENVEIAYSCLFGDKTLLSENQQGAYRLSGIAHLLAVSGLHVGIIVMVLTKILKLMRIKKWGNLGVISVFLLFYMYICNFSVSVIRASIMSVILLISKILHEEYDTYNSISIAGIVIFLINPLCVFDISFLMSFSCVLGIAMLYKPILTALTKIKMNRKIAESMAISLSTTTCLIMITAFYFNNVNAISVFANVIIIPIFTIAFIPTFIISIVSTILPFVAYLLYPLNYVFDFINLLATIFGNLSIANFNTLSINYIAIVVYFILILLIGRLCSAKYQYKIAISIPTLALLVYCLL